MLNKENTNTANFGPNRPSKSGYNLRAFGKDAANIPNFKGKSQSNVRKPAKQMAYPSYLRKDSKVDPKHTKSFLPSTEDMDVDMSSDQERLARFKELQEKDLVR